MTLPVVRVTCAVIIREGKVFAARRGPRSKQPLKWEFPGGKVEPGETDEQCLLRELAEELRIRVRIEGRLPAHIHHYPEFTIELIPFLCALEQDGHTVIEHHETAWLDPGELPDMDWTAADVPLAVYVLKHLL
jgi:8-oxo-dGTP diphosphatase